MFWFTLVLATIVFILVEGLLIYSSLRFRRRTPLPTLEPPQIHGNTRLEVMWATVPALILIGLFVESAIFRVIEARTVQRWGMER